MGMSQDYDVIIIGSGVGGLTAASVLAGKGLKTLVLERLDRVGGCCSNYDHNGFKPDTGAVFVLLRQMYYKLFELLERRLEDYIDFKLVDPVYHYYMDDGMDFSLPRDIEGVAEVISTISPGDVGNLYRYCEDMKKFRQYYHALLEYPIAELSDIGKISTLVKMAANRRLISSLPINIKLALCNADRVSKSYFRDPRVQLMMGWETLYLGMPSSKTMGFDAAEGYCQRTGYYYPKGGMIAIPRALQRLAEEAGAEVRLNSEVKRIRIENGVAKGVELAGGETLTSKVVISNAHSRVTYLKLVGEEHLPRWASRTVRRQPCSIPAPTILLGLSEPLESIRSHLSIMVPPKEQFDNYWRDYYHRGLLHNLNDGIYMTMSPSMDDPGLAPPGKQILSILPVMPYRLKYHDWDDISEDWAWQIVGHMDKRYYPGLADSIEWIDPITPKELERRLNLPEGGFLGLEMSLTNVGPFRPGNRSRVVRGLYLAGQCTCIGGGVPFVMASGLVASALVMKDWTEGI